MKAIIDYMEKVEVLGLENAAAFEQIQREHAGRAALAASPAIIAAAGVLGEENGSMGSWATSSLGGISGAGTNAVSLGSLAATSESAPGGGRSSASGGDDQRRDRRRSLREEKPGKRVSSKGHVQFGAGG